MSRRRHSDRAVIHGLGHALLEVLQHLIVCPICQAPIGKDQNTHRDNCEVRLATRQYQEYKGIEART